MLLYTVNSYQMLHLSVMFSELIFRLIFHTKNTAIHRSTIYISFIRDFATHFVNQVPLTDAEDFYCRKFSIIN